MEQQICLSITSIYIMGGFYVVMALYIIYLVYIVCVNKRTLYKTYEVSETSKRKFIKSELVNDKKPLIHQSAFNVAETENIFFEEKEIETKGNNKDVNKHVNRDLQMVKNNNPNVIALISPIEMKNLCDGVLKKNTKLKVKPKFTVPESDIHLNDVDKQECTGTQLNKNRKSVSIQNLYDVVRHPKPVNVKLRSQDDIALLEKRKNSCMIIRDTLTQYVFPLSSRNTYYVNAQNQ